MNRKDVVDTSEPFTRQKFMCKSWLQNEMIYRLTGQISWHSWIAETPLRILVLFPHVIFHHSGPLPFLSLFPRFWKGIDEVWRRRKVYYLPNSGLHANYPA